MIVEARARDIVLTERVSGVPVAVEPATAIV